MTLTHYIGGKLTGLTADFPPSLNYPNLTTFINVETFQEFILVSGVWEQIGQIPAVGGWKELGRTTLGSLSTTVTVPSNYPSSVLANKRYYMYLINKLPSGNISSGIRLGNAGTVDSGLNYATRESSNGGAEDAQGNTGHLLNRGAGSDDDITFSVGYLANVNNKEKLQIGHVADQKVAGAGNPPARGQNVGKWVNTSDPLDVFQIFDVGAGGNYAVGTEVVILEWDPTDNHTDNFWEELASVDLSGGSAQSLTANFTAKKYLWVQFFLEDNGAIGNAMSFNGDNGMVYARRESFNGASDATAINLTAMNFMNGNLARPKFGNMFIINVLAREKLVIAHGYEDTQVGAGAIGNRYEDIFKYANTSQQITSITLTNARSGAFGTRTIMKVWDLTNGLD